MRRVAAMLGVIALAVGAGFAIYLSLIRSPLFAGVTILFYRGTLLALVAAATLVAVLALAARRVAIDVPTIVAAAVASLSVNTAFLVILPVTIDRSISVFLLARIDAAQGSPPDTRALRTAFVDDYVGDMRQIERRVQEQTVSGNVVVEDGRIRLSPQGKRFVALSRWLAAVFRTDPRFVGSAPPRADVSAAPVRRDPP